MGFTNTFGGSAVSPSEVAFASYSFGANANLFWPAFSSGNPNIAARFMNISTSVASVNIFMPDATLISVGQDNIIFNNGINSFNIVNFSGGAIATIAPGQTYYILLNANATQAGTWQTVQFGVGTGAASAAALQGAGLLALAALLNVNFNATTLGGSTTLTSAARAILQVWTGGAGTLTLPSAATVGNGFFFPFANNGSGTVTISSADKIDGATTSDFGLTQSAFIVSSGATWYTVGKGTQTNFATTLLNLNVAGNADITETSAQAQNIIQQYTGVITGNINVIVPATPQIYFCFNSTSGAFTLTVKTSGGSGIAITQGQNTILYCDGTDIVNAFSSSFGGAISIAAGAAGSPNLNIIGSVTTGIFSLAPGQLSITANGYIVTNFRSAASSVNYIENASSATATAVSSSAVGVDANIDYTLNAKGTGHVNIAAVNITGGAINGAIIGGSNPAAITGTNITATAAITAGTTLNAGTTITSGTTITAGTSIAAGSTVTGTSLISTVSTGTAPLTVTSTTQVANLNAATAGTANAAISGGITNGMLAGMTANSIKGNSVNATGNAADLVIANGQVVSTVNNVTGSTTLSLVMDTAFGGTQGNVIQRGASAWQVLTAGTSGQSLLTGGGSANAVWGNPLMTALGVGSIINAGNYVSSVNAGDTAPGSGLTAYDSAGNTTGDTLSGTWRTMQALTAGRRGIWQRIA